MTVAHNTVVVDELTQNGGDARAAETVSGRRHFFEASDQNVQAMSAMADDHYDGVRMQRTMLLIRDVAMPYPFVVDLYRLVSNATHSYDYPIHFNGQPIFTNVDYERPEALHPLGEGHGYQHLWKEGHGTTDDPVQFTWLDGSRYYTFHAAGAPETEVVFARTGAADPDFNLRSEPAILLRREAGVHLFASVLEPHGTFDEARETSTQARPLIEGIEIVGHDDAASVIRIHGPGTTWTVIVNNGPSTNETRRLQAGGRSFELDGNVTVNRSEE